jgi:hypothetical protein
MCVLGAIVGYRSGFDRGYANGAEPWIGKPLEVRTYQLADLKVTQSGTATDSDVVRELVTQIHMGSWDDLGGPGTVDVVGPYEIKIKHTAEMHETISQVLQAIRDGRRQSSQNTSK